MHTPRLLSALLALVVCGSTWANDEEFAEATYKVDQLMGDDLDETDMADFVRSWVGDHWDAPAKIEVVNGGLKVYQSVKHHAVIKLALDELIRAFTKEPRSLAEWRKVHAAEVAAQRKGADANDKAVYTALEQPVTLQLTGLSWAQALKLLGAQTGVELALHPSATVDGMVKLDVKEVSLEAALEALLANDPEAGLAWVVREGKLTVGDPDSLELPRVSRIYDASAFKGGESLDPEELIEACELCLPLESGSVEFAHGRLIVHKPHGTHAKLMDLLEDAAKHPAKYRKLLEEDR